MENANSYGKSIILVLNINLRKPTRAPNGHTVAIIALKVNSIR